MKMKLKSKTILLLAVVSVFLTVGSVYICYNRYTNTMLAKYKGNVAAMYLLLYGIGRFLIEFLRDDYRGAVGFLSTSQFISIIMVILSFALFYFNKRRGVQADQYRKNAEVQ